MCDLVPAERVGRDDEVGPGHAIITGHVDNDLPLRSGSGARDRLLHYHPAAGQKLAGRLDRGFQGGALRQDEPLGVVDPSGVTVVEIDVAAGDRGFRGGLEHGAGGTRRAQPDLLAGRHGSFRGDRLRACPVCEHIRAGGGDGGSKARGRAYACAVTVNGPSTLRGPLAVARGDGEAGRWWLDKRSLGSDLVHDGNHGVVQRVGGVEHVAVGKEPDGRLYGGGRLVGRGRRAIGQRGRFVGVGVELVEHPRHVTHVHDVRGAPRTQGVTNAAIRVGVDVDAVEIRVAPPPGGVPWITPAKPSSLTLKPSSGVGLLAG